MMTKNHNRSVIRGDASVPIEENENEDSVFYHRLDLENIGISGHSQGGPAVFNMATWSKPCMI